MAVREVPKALLKMASGRISPSGHWGQLCIGPTAVPTEHIQIVEHLAGGVEQVGGDHDDEASDHRVDHHVAGPEVEQERGLHGLQYLVLVHDSFWMYWSILFPKRFYASYL